MVPFLVLCVSMVVPFVWCFLAHSGMSIVVLLPIWVICFLSVLFFGVCCEVVFVF